MHWLDDHKNHAHQLIYTHVDTIIMGDSIAAGLSRYSNVRETFSKESLNVSTFFGGWSVYLFQAT